MWRQTAACALLLSCCLSGAASVADRAALTASLAQHGVAFFPNAFSKEECDILLQQFVDNCDVNEVLDALALVVFRHATRGSPVLRACTFHSAASALRVQDAPILLPVAAGEHAHAKCCICESTCSRSSASAADRASCVALSLSS